MKKAIYNFFTQLHRKKTSNPFLLLEAGLLILFTFTILTKAIENFSNPIHLNEAYTKTISQYESRLKPIKDDLPSSVDVIGYLDNTFIANESAQPDIAAEYAITQFSMSPTIIQRGNQHEFILLNMTKDYFEIWFEKESENYNISFYGFNLYLAQRTHND